MANSLFCRTIQKKRLLHPKNVQSYFIIKLHCILKNIIFSFDHFQYSKRNTSKINHISLDHSLKQTARNEIWQKNVFTGQSKFNKFSIQIVRTKRYDTLIFRLNINSFFWVSLLRYWPSSTHRLLVLLCDWTIVSLFGLLNYCRMKCRWIQIQKLVDSVCAIV